MTAQRISARSLLRETLAVVGSVYPALLTINSPHLIWFVLENLGRDALELHIIERTLSEHPGAGTFPVNPIYRLAEVPFWIYWLVAVPLLWGATTFYTYRSLTGNQVTASDAFQQAKRRFLPLIGVYFLFLVMILALAGLMWFVQSFAFWVYGGYHITDYCSRFLDALGVRICGLFIITANSGEPIFLGLILLVIIPGLYLWYRLIFSPYATVIDNSSILESLNSSWKLTEGRWWLVFRSNLLITFVFFVPAILISGLIGSKLDNTLASQVVGQVLGFIAGVLINVYLILLYRRLRDSAATIQ